MLEYEWFQDLESTHLMLAWVANMHNLATLYEAMGLPQKASPYLIQPYRRILTLMKEHEFSHVFHHDLGTAMRSSITALLQFTQKHPICPCCQKEITKMQHWLNQTEFRLANMPSDPLVLDYGIPTRASTATLH